MAQHRNTDGMEELIALFEAGGVRACFSGHEHNFQHSHHGGIDYFVSGAGSKLRKGSPDGFDAAHTLSWSDYAHFLLVTIAGDTMRVRPIGEVVTRYHVCLDVADRAGVLATVAVVFARHGGSIATVNQAGRGADAGLVERWAGLAEWPQSLLYALLFRAAAHALHPDSTASSFAGLRHATIVVRDIFPS